MGQRFFDFFKEPVAVSVVLFCMGFAILLFPGLSDIALVIGLWIFLYAYTRKITLPFRLPLRSKMIDHNDPIIGTNKPQKGRGIAFFGNTIRGNEELWFNNEDMRTHVLIFGSTGSGKTEALVSIAANAFIHGSGLIYVDGKGDNSLFAKIFAMARRMGREDDVLLINFMTGARDIIGPQERRLSNTMNPFSTGSSSMLTQLVVSLMDSSSATPDGDMWKGRAISFVESLMKILVYMRDSGHILLDANTIRNYFSLDRLVAMVADKQFIRDDAEPVSLEGAPPLVLEPVKNYLATLPGFDKAKKEKQAQQTLEQHGYITMQLTRVFTSLADTYAHIIRTNLAEVDFHDVVLNRRILVVLLPALEKSTDELSNLGKVIVSTLKAIMASGLGSQVEGSYREMIQRKPTTAPTPFLCILDEYGYYAVPGFAVVPAQARSLGFSAIFAGQDLPAFQKASKEEAASIGANCNIKICMKLEDPVETWEFFSKTAGEAYVTKVDSFQTRAQSVLNNYLDTRSASTEKRARIDLLDLKEQRESEAHIFFKSKVIRARMFFANITPTKHMRLNHFLKVEKPATRLLKDLELRLERFQNAIESQQSVTSSLLDSSEDIQRITDIFKANAALEPMERGIKALLDLHQQKAEPVTEMEAEEMMETPETELNIFTPLRVTDETRDFLMTDNLETFSQPLIEKAVIRSAVGNIERVSGRPEKHAMNIAAEIVNDMQTATFYPPTALVTPMISEITDTIDELIEKIKQGREEAENQDKS
jgi:intracellular multiplication protein IcmO